MFDPAAPEPPAAAPAAAVQSAGGLPRLPVVNGLAISLPPVDLEAPAAGLVDQITARENAKDAIAADQARLMVALDQRIRAERAAKGVPAARQGEGIAKQVGLARRESPNYGALLLGRAKVLVNQMPHTLKALQAGILNERRAAILVSETDCLSPEHRAVVDEELAGNPGPPARAREPAAGGRSQTRRLPAGPARGGEAGRAGRSGPVCLLPARTRRDGLGEDPAAGGAGGRGDGRAAAGGGPAGERRGPADPGAGDGRYRV